MASASDGSGRIAGQAHREGASRRWAATLTWGADGRLVLTSDEDGTLLVTGAAEKIETMPGSPALVHLPEGWLFRAPAGEDLCGLRGPRPGGWLSRAEAWHPRLAAVVLVCLLAALAIWRWGLNILVAAGMAVTPEIVVTGIDRSNIEIIDRLMADESHLGTDDRAAVQAIFDNLIAKAPPAPWGEYRLLFRDMPDIGPNAFALPGGTMIVTDQMVEMFGDDPDVLAGVLGHEIAHVSQRHVLRQLYRAGSSYLLITLIAGDPGPFLQDMLREGNALLSLSYSRAHESDADLHGVALARAAGYDGAALARFFERLQEEYGASGPGWLSTHPANAARIEAIRALAGQKTD